MTKVLKWQNAKFDNEWSLHYSAVNAEMYRENVSFQKITSILSLKTFCHLRSLHMSSNPMFLRGPIANVTPSSSWHKDFKMKTMILVVLEQIYEFSRSHKMDVYAVSHISHIWLKVSKLLCVGGAVETISGSLNDHFPRTYQESDMSTGYPFYNMGLSN